MASEIVECDDCGKKVTVRQDGTVSAHHWTRRGVKHNCPRSGKPYSRHAGTFRVIKRDSTGLATQWIAECRCGETWIGPDHVEVERGWSEHRAVAAAPVGEEQT